MSWEKREERKIKKRKENERMSDQGHVGASWKQLDGMILKTP
jgi:hypothetical protein